MKDKKKVLLISPYSKKKVGGIGTWTKLVLDYSLSREDIKVVFQNTVHALPKRWSMNNKLTHLIIGSADSIMIILKLIYNLCLKRPDVVHYTSSAASALYKDRIAAFITKKIFRKKFIIHWRFGRIPTIFTFKGKEYKNFIKVLRIVDDSIVLDEASFNVLKNAGYKVELIPNPIPLKLQKIAEKMMLTDLCAKRNQGIVLFVGHMLKTKGIFELVKACSHSSYVKQLIMVGPFFEDSLKNQLIEMSKKRENGEWLHLVGEKSREQVWDYYKSCSVFCLPSYTEGFPNVILEAMAFACPIVATKVGAIPEMLSDGCGELIEVKTVEMLRTSIDKVISNTQFAENMGKKALSAVLDRYTIGRVFDMYVSLWQSI